jgi:hypothetical protein
VLQGEVALRRAEQRDADPMSTGMRLMMRHWMRPARRNPWTVIPPST